MPLARFDTPGRLRDAPDGSAFYPAWHTVVNDAIRSGTPGTGGVGEFYNPTTKDVDLVGERAMLWMGFPRRVMVEQQRDDRREAFRLADQFTIGDRRRQEEYLEWRAESTAGKITKVTFTCEVPEYWNTLFQHEPNVVVQLYQQLTGDSSIVQANLMSGGEYNKDNAWNTTKGMVHLTVDQLPNTLGAALGLATGSAGIGTGGAHYRDNYEFQQREPQAPPNADPHVTMDGNTLVRKNLSVTARDPVGLYIAGWDDTGWAKPDGKPVSNYWRIVRGVPGAALRVEYQVPASEGFVVGDIRIGGRLIEFGGQIAEHLTVTIVGVAGTPRPEPADPS
jgi:hypothetical protein